jgi:hypothetical protein
MRDAESKLLYNGPIYAFEEGKIEQNTIGLTEKTKKCTSCHLPRNLFI